MSVIYAALMLRSAGKPITRDNLTALLKAAGVQASLGEIDALLSLLGSKPAPAAAEEPASQTARPASAQVTELPSQPSAPSKSGEALDPDQLALYVYVVAVGEPIPFETAGVDGAAVFALAEDSLVAVVHECSAQPYSSQDKKTVEEWVLSHQAIVEEAYRHYEAVLPMAFDTMVPGKHGGEAADRLRGWLRDEGDVLRRKADRVRNREEYGVQVLWDVESATREVMDTCPAIVEFKKGLGSKSEGAAYLYKQQLEKLVKGEIEKRAEIVFREAFELARQHAVEVSVEGLKRTEGNMRMVANLSCLVEKGRDEALKAAFNDCCAGNGLAARVTGPWPPYSFV